VNPKPSYGSRGAGVGGTPTYSYRSPGYGTNFGTNFASGVGRYPTSGTKGFSKKALGLGVGAGFLGGAALGVAGTAATYGVYHRYHQYQMMRMMMNGGSWNHGYYNNYYSNNQCFGGCPIDAHCEWGFCECNRGLEKRYGRCERNWGGESGRPAGFNPFQPCSNTANCQRLDMNLVCNTNLTTGDGGRCECRQDMKWNTEAGECQLYMDVDCSDITYDTKASPVILEAVNKTLEKIAENNTTEVTTVATTTTTTTEANSDLSGNDTTPISSSPDEALKNSLLTSIDVNKTSEAELKEAYCRDIDSFSWEFGAPKNLQQNQNYNYGDPDRIPAGAGATMAVGTIVIIVLFFCCCCCACCVCAACKGKKKIGKVLGKSGSEEPPVTYSDVNVNEAMGGGYKSDPTPQHNTYSDSGVLYPGPAAIPPTQPGYTNYPGTEAATNPAQVYPPIQTAAYPPADGGLPYPAQPGNPGMTYPGQQQAYNPNALP